MEKPSPPHPLTKRGEDGGDSGGRGGFSERSPSPPRPLSSEERLAFELCASSEGVPPERWRDFDEGGCVPGG